MSNSPLVSYTQISPNSSNPRNNKITKITIHHVGGIATVEGLGAVFASPARQASANYGIGSDGRIGMYVEEKNRSWCSSSRDNDNQAITIEVSNDEVGGDWHVSDKVLAKLIDLCVDICQRNGIKKLNFTGNTNGNLTAHRMLASTLCPGPYLYSKFPYIAQEVNKRLGAKTSTATLAPAATASSALYCVQVGAFQNKTNASNQQKALKAKGFDGYVAKDGALYRVQVGAFKDKVNANAMLKKLETAGFKGMIAIKGKAAEAKLPYMVQVTATALNIRKGAGSGYPIVGCITDKGAYTIIEEKDGWGRLKSKVGWISLEYTKKI